MDILNVILVIISFALSIIYYPSLPQKLPMHWNLQGQVDNYMPKSSAAWLMPVLTLIILILFRYIPKLDPKKEKYLHFDKEWHIIQTALISFFVYLHAVVLFISLNPSVELLPFMFAGLGILFILLGNYLSKIRQNYFIGIKLPWTLSSEDNWNKTHRYASWCFVIVGMVTLIEAFVIWNASLVIFGGIFLSVVLPVIYSILIFKKAEDRMMYVYLVLIGLFLLVFSFRLVSGEDDWICRDGTWVMHGHPSGPMPLTTCPN